MKDANCPDNTTKVDAKNWVPPGYTVFKDSGNGRWRVSGPCFDISRSFLKWGEVQAFAHACSEAWAFEQPSEGCPHNWVVEVVKKSGKHNGS